MVFKILLLVVFFVIMLGVGVYCRRRSASVNDFVLGERSVGPWLSAFAYGTTYFSAVIFVGYAGQFGWRFGTSAVWIGLSNALVGSLLPWLILGRRTRRMTQRLDAATMPAFFEKRYGSKSLKLASSLIIFLFLIPYTASLYNGLSRIFGMAFNIDYTVCVIVMAILTCVYVVVGGYMATAINDLIQGIIMLVGVAAVIISVLNGQGGFTEAVKSLTSINGGTYTSLFGPEPLNLVGVIILTSMGAWGLPQMLHKFYAIKNEKSIPAGAIISTVFALIIGGGAYFLGGFGRLFDNPSLYKSGKIVYDAIIPHMLSSMSDILIGVFLVLVLSASMSTLSALVMTSASTLTAGFYRRQSCEKNG